MHGLLRLENHFDIVVNEVVVKDLHTCYLRNAYLVYLRSLCS
jgi:hypothetical protein